MSQSSASFLTELMETVERVFRKVLRQEMPMLQKGDPNQLIETESAALLCGMTTGAFRRAHERGHLPIKPYQIGKRRKLKWRLGDIQSLNATTDAVLNNGTVTK